MHLIAHRRNSLTDLKATPTQFGVEVDIRSQSDKLLIHHDAFVQGNSFDEWIAAYRHGTLILNVKEEGLEVPLMALMQRHRIEDWFFLDQSFPFLIKHARAGNRRAAVRVSEYESIETALTLAGQIDWVWVDCFTHFPLSGEDAHRLERAGFKLCLVSPELQGRAAETEIPAMARLLRERHIKAEAVCTKRPDLWGRESL
jgi:hypothetical protein